MPSTPTPRSGCCAAPPTGRTTASSSSSAGARSCSSSTTAGSGTRATTPPKASASAPCAARPPATPTRPRSARPRSAARAETARLAVGSGGGTLAAPPQATNQRLYTDRDPFDDAEFAVKVEMLREIDDFLRGLDPRVVQVSASLGASMQEVEILRPDGMRLAEARPMVRLNISVIVEENGRRELGSAGGGGRHGLAPLMGTDHWKDRGAGGAAHRRRQPPRRAGPGGRHGRRPRPRAGPASSCTRRSATASRATSTARRPRPSPASSAPASPRPGSP